MSQSGTLGRRRRAAILAVLTAALVIPATASADPGHFRGVVTAHTPAGRAYGQQIHPAKRRGSANLTYHGGQVMHADRNYAIYWEAGGFGTSAGFKSIVTGYFGNVAAASGQTSNDYSVATQYYDATGNIAYSSTSGGGLTDTDAYPASGCRAGGGGPCITDAQLQTELNAYLTRNGLARGMSTMYFVYFPPNVTTCFDSSGSQCSSNV